MFKTFAALASLTFLSASAGLAQTYHYAYFGGIITSSEVTSSAIAAGDVYIGEIRLDYDIVDTSSSSAGGIFVDAATFGFEMLSGHASGTYSSGSSAVFDFAANAPNQIDFDDATGDVSGYNMISGNAMTSLYFTLTSSTTAISYTNNTGNALGDVLIDTENFTNDGLFYLQFGGSDEVNGSITYFEVFSSAQTSASLASTVAASAVPEPSTYAALFGGFALIVTFVVRRKRVA